MEPIYCNWCGCEIEDPDDAYPVNEDEDGNDLYWCGECEEGENDPECVGGETEDQ